MARRLDLARVGETLTGAQVSHAVVYDGLEDPGRPIPPESTAVHHITDEMVAGRRLDEAAIERLLDGVGVVIAHNAEGHSDKKWLNWGLGTLLDLIAAAYGVNTQRAFGDAASKVYSQDFERETDYVGMYLLAAAGVDTTEAADFWRRMAAEYPQSIKGSHAASHPASAERWVNIDATNVEIAGKRGRGAALVPERKR